MATVSELHIRVTTDLKGLRTLSEEAARTSDEVARAFEETGRAVREAFLRLEDGLQGVETRVGAGVAAARDLIESVDGVRVEVERAGTGVAALGSGFEEVGSAGAAAAEEIGASFAELVDLSLRGKFDDLESMWTATLSGMSRLFGRFVASISGQAIPVRVLPVAAGGVGGVVSPLPPLGGGGGILSPGFPFFGPSGLEGLIGGTAGTVVGLGAQGLFLGALPGFSMGGLPGSLFGGVLGAAGNIGGFALGSALGLSTLGASLVGGVLGIVGGILGGLLGSLFQKKPQIDIEIPGEFGGNQREWEKAVADGLKVTVQDFIDATTDEALAESLIWIKTRKIDDVNEDIRKRVLAAITEAINKVTAVIFRLPEEMAQRLLDAFRSTELKLAETEDDFLLEFDEKSKSVKKLFDKLEKFLGGELQGRFLFAVRDFFTGALEQLGVLPEKAQDLIEGKFQEFLQIKGRENRAAAGQELFNLFNAFVDAFNIVNDRFGDAVTDAIAQLRGLAGELGFTGIPTFEQFKASLQTLIQEAELDPQIVEKYKALRQAILSTIDAITSSISGLVSSIGSLNATIVSLGGDAVDTTGATQQVVDTLRSLLQSGGLSMGEREGLLGQLASFANQLLAQEQARAQAELASRRQGLQQRIDALTREKELIQENFRARIEALQEELRAAEAFKSLSESIRGDLEGVLFSPSAPLTGGEQMGMLQALIAAAQGGTTPEAIDRLRGLLTRGFELATRAFGVGSPEQQAVFTQVTTQLQDLQRLTEEKGARAEEIQAQIEALNREQAEALASIDATIRSVQSQMSDQVALSADVAENLRGLFEFIRDQELQILQERLNQLAEVTNVQGDAQLVVLQSIDQTLKDIDKTLQGTAPAGGLPVLRRFAHGGVITEPTLAVGLRSGRHTLMGEAGPEYVVPARGGAGAVTVTIGDIVVQGAADPEATAREVERRILDSVRRGRLARELRSVA